MRKSSRWLTTLKGGLAAVPENEKDSAFVEGMNKVYKQLMTELDNMGVKPIEAARSEFDPNFHNAVMHVEDENTVRTS